MKVERMVTCLKQHQKEALTSQYTHAVVHPSPLIQADMPLGCAANQIKNSSNLKNKVNKTPCLQKKKERKEENLIAGGVTLVRSRSQQSPVIITTVEVRCHSAGAGTSGNSQSRGNSRSKSVPWVKARVSEHLSPGEIAWHITLCLFLFTALKTHHQWTHSKPPSTGKVLNPCVNCHLFFAVAIENQEPRQLLPSLFFQCNLVPVKTECQTVPIPSQQNSNPNH